MFCAISQKLEINSKAQKSAQPSPATLKVTLNWVGKTLSGSPEQYRTFRENHPSLSKTKNPLWGCKASCVWAISLWDLIFQALSWWSQGESHVCAQLGKKDQVSGMVSGILQEKTHGLWKKDIFVIIPHCWEQQSRRTEMPGPRHLFPRNNPDWIVSEGTTLPYTAQPTGLLYKKFLIRNKSSLSCHWLYGVAVSFYGSLVGSLIERYSAQHEALGIMNSHVFVVTTWISQGSK